MAAPHGVSLPQKVMKPRASAWLLVGASAVLMSTAGAKQFLLKQEVEVPALLGALTGVSNGTAPAFVDPLDGCFEVGKSICIGDPIQGSSKTFMFRPPSTLPELAVWYSFDKSLPVDESGHLNHLKDSDNNLTPLESGPGILGRGASASFDGKTFRTLPSNDGLETGSLTVALWVYLTEDSVGSWRTIFSKGSNADQLNPALLLYPDERRLQARMSPHAGQTEQGLLDSQGLLPLRRWTHIALTSTGGVMRLFLNGQMDGEAIVGAPQGIPDLAGNKAPIRLGRDPWRAGFKGYMDDFRWYNRVLLPSEVRALTFPSLTGIGTDFVKLGCKSCTFPEAVDKCKGGTHMCSQQELFAGGYHTARVMGWMPTTPNSIWIYNEKGTDLFAGQKRLGLCCLTN